MFPGWDGLEEVDPAASGPGDFKAAFDAAPGTSTQKLVGYGTSRDSGRRCAQGISIVSTNRQTSRFPSA